MEQTESQKRAMKVVNILGGAKEFSKITGVSINTCKSWSSGRRGMPKKKYDEFEKLIDEGGK